MTYDFRMRNRPGTSRQGMLRLILSDKVTVTVGTILVVLVFAFLALHALVRGSMAPDEAETTLLARLFGTISIESDSSIAESFTHGMSFSAAVLFLASAIASGSRFCVLLSMLMGFAWFDDSAQFHERVGGMFQEIGFIPDILGFGLQTQGELAAWLMISLVLMPVAIWAVLGRQPGDKNVLKLIALPVSLLVISAVVMDLLHTVLSASYGRILMYLEDGGEMVAIAILVTVALFLARNAHLIAPQGVADTNF